MPAAEAARFSRARRRGARARGARVGEGRVASVLVVAGAAPRRRWDAGGVRQSAAGQGVARAASGCGSAPGRGFFSDVRGPADPQRATRGP